MWLSHLMQLLCGEQDAAFACTLPLCRGLR
jgi:hypothetical protein